MSLDAEMDKSQKEADITMKMKAFRAAFPYTIPIFAGFWFLALAYGIYMNANGFSFVYPMLMSMLIYGGSFLLPIRKRFPIFSLTIFCEVSIMKTAKGEIHL